MNTKKKCSTPTCENFTSQDKCVICSSNKVSKHCQTPGCGKSVRKNTHCVDCARAVHKLKPCSIPGCKARTADEICSKCKIKLLSKKSSTVIQPEIIPESENPQEEPNKLGDLAQDCMVDLIKVLEDYIQDKNKIVLICRVITPLLDEVI